MVSSGRREYWWLAKCGWEIVSSFGYLLMLALGVLSYCLVFRIPIKAEISQRLVEVMIGWGLDRSLPQAEVWLWLLVIPLLLLIFLNLLQLLVGLVFGPIWGFAVNGALLSALGLLDEVVSAGKLRHVPPEYLGADRSGHGHGERSRSSDRGKPLCDRSWGYSLPSERHSEEGVMSAE